MAEIRIERFRPELSEKWDKFIQQQSYNGTFLQSRNFLSYHKEGKFQDCSLVVYKGTSDILAVVPACERMENGVKEFVSHQGSTFGGIVFHKEFYNIEHVEQVLEKLEQYWQENNYGKVVLKQSSQIFASKDNDLLEYFLFQRGYKHYSEISFVIDLKKYGEDIPVNFSARRRRDYKYSLKCGLAFQELTEREEIAAFYSVLSDNLSKFGATPVHSLEELYEFKENRLQDIVHFYGAFQDEKLVAGSMVFLFDQKVFHTQYLAAAQDALKCFPNNFLDANLIAIAKKQGFDWFSFGISTEERGEVLNKHLAQFKEGFGTGYSNNKTWYKVFSWV